MGMKSMIRSVKSNKPDVEIFAYETAEHLFEYFSAEEEKNLKIAKTLTLDIFTRKLIEEIDFLCMAKAYKEQDESPILYGEFSEYLLNSPGRCQNIQTIASKKKGRSLLFSPFQFNFNLNLIGK